MTTWDEIQEDLCAILQLKSLITNHVVVRTHVHIALQNY